MPEIDIGRAANLMLKSYGEESTRGKGDMRRRARGRRRSQWRGNLALDHYRS
jgi:hypothetical protein